MARTSSQWRTLAHLIQDTPLLGVNPQMLKQFSLKAWNGPGGWFMVTAGAVALLFWNGRLVLATGVGISVMMLVYLLQDGRWRFPKTDLRQWLSGWNRNLLLAVGSGGAATLGTYMAASIWVEAESHWAATGSILQGVGTLGVLLLLLWQQTHRQTGQERSSFSQSLQDLTHADPLKRLIAVHQLTERLAKREEDRSQQQYVANCFRLMLSREPEAIVREAVLEGLQTLDHLQPLGQAKTTPLKVQPPKRVSPSRTPLPPPTAIPKRVRAPKNVNA